MVEANRVRPVLHDEPEDFFNKLLEQLRSGYTHSGIQEEATYMAEKHGFPNRKVEEAVKQGARTNYDSYISSIRLGATHMEGSARELAEQYGFPLGGLETALVAGKNNLKNIQ